MAPAADATAELALGDEPSPPRADERSEVRDQTFVKRAPSALPAGGNLWPAIAALGAIGGLVIGFAGGRLTAPRVGTSAPRPVAAITPATTIAPVAIATEAPVVETPIEPTPMPTIAVAIAPATTPPPTPVIAVKRTPTAVPTPTATALAALLPPKSTKPATKTLPEALALVDAGKVDDAIVALEGIVKQEPANADAHWALARLYRSQRKGPKACSHFKAYAKNAPGGSNVPGAKRQIAVCDGVALLDAEKLDEAHAAFQAIVVANWTFADGHYWLGTMQALRNENAAACKSFKSYLRLDAKGPYSDRCQAQLTTLGC